MLDGLLKTRADQLGCAADYLHCIFYSDSPVFSEAAFAAGGGLARLPVFLGYVGQACRTVAPTMTEVTRRIHGGRGVFYIYSHYGGDATNFDMATEIVGMEDIEAPRRARER